MLSHQRIKGSSRPINKELDQAQILSGLRCVDYVTILSKTCQQKFWTF